MADEKGKAPVVNPVIGAAEKSRILSFLDKRTAERKAAMPDPGERAEATPEPKDVNPEPPPAPSTGEETPSTPEPEGEPRQTKDGKDTDEARVPYDRFEKVIKERDSKDAEIKRLERDLKKLQEQGGKRKQEDIAREFLSGEGLPEDFATWEDDQRSAYLAAKAASYHANEIEELRNEVANMRMERELSKRLGMNLTADQFDAVVSIARATDGELSPEECLEIAKSRHASAFKGPVREVPPAQRQQRPSGAGRQKPGANASVQKKWDAFKSARTTGHKMSAAVDYIRERMRSQ